jgi:hypothetical protein
MLPPRAAPPTRAGGEGHTSRAAFVAGTLRDSTPRSVAAYRAGSCVCLRHAVGAGVGPVRGAGSAERNAECSPQPSARRGVRTRVLRAARERATARSAPSGAAHGRFAGRWREAQSLQERCACRGGRGRRRGLLRRARSRQERRWCVARVAPRSCCRAREPRAHARWFELLRSCAAPRPCSQGAEGRVSQAGAQVPPGRQQSGTCPPHVRCSSVRRFR